MTTNELKYALNYHKLYIQHTIQLVIIYTIHTVLPKVSKAIGNNNVYEFIKRRQEQNISFSRTIKFAFKKTALLRANKKLFFFYNNCLFAHLIYIYIYIYMHSV